MTPERLRQLTTLYTAYQSAVNEVTAEFERLYGPQDGPVDRWVWECWADMYEGRPEVVAMVEADTALPVSERCELAEMVGAGDDTRLEELLWRLEWRQLQ